MGQSSEQLHLCGSARNDLDAPWAGTAVLYRENVRPCRQREPTHALSPRTCRPLLSAWRPLLPFVEQGAGCRNVLERTSAAACTALSTPQALAVGTSTHRARHNPAHPPLVAGAELPSLGEAGARPRGRRRQQRPRHLTRGCEIGTSGSEP